MKLKTLFSLVSLVVLSTALLPFDVYARGGSLGTATVGGTFYTWAGPWTKMVSDSVPGYQINVEVTGGPVHNVRLVDAGELEFGLCSIPAAHDGYVGENWAKGRTYTNIRTLFPMYPSYATIWSLQKSGIKSIHDLEGKIFAPGPKGGTPDTYYRLMLDLLGIKADKIVNSGFSDLVGQLGDGMVDAAAGTGGNPFGPAMESEATAPINIVDIPLEDMEKIVKAQPYWFIGERPAGGYKDFPTAKPVLQYWNIYITNNELSDDIAYKLTKAFYDNLAKFENVYAPTMDTKHSDVLYSTIPIHPGAAKYYKEMGVDIPANKIGK